MMLLRSSLVIAAAGLCLALPACDKAAAPAPSNDIAAAPALGNDPVQNALSAAPPGIAKAAAVVTMNPDGSMKSLKAGSNGFTCMPDNPETPGPDPMCMDANAMEWVGAWVGRKPPADKAGLIYMLAGGTDASNTDPYAKDPKSGNWVETGAHVMIVGSPTLNAVYNGGEKPDTTAPYVMWAGTPYAHVMIPVR